MVDSRKRSSRVGLVCKLDIEEAYNHVDWSFLLLLMEKMGFGVKWRNWSQFCVSFVRMAVLVNGSLRVLPVRGLRQGDPLSSYLFVLVMEALSGLISRIE